MLDHFLHRILRFTTKTALDFQKHVFPSNSYYAKALCFLDELLGLKTCYSMLFDSIIFCHYTMHNELNLLCFANFKTNINPLVLLRSFYCFFGYRMDDLC